MYHWSPSGVQTQFWYGQLGATRGFRCRPRLSLHRQAVRRDERRGYRFRSVLSAGDDENICFPYRAGAHSASEQVALCGSV